MNVYQFTVYEDFFEALKISREEKSYHNAYTPIHHEEVARLTETLTPGVNRGFYGGAFLGFITAALITYVPNVITFKINVGGRPLNSWPAFAIIAFELMVLFSGLGAVGGFLFGNRYPRYDRKIFDLDEFNEKDHGEYFLVTKKELSHVKGHRHYHLTTPR